MSHDHARTAGGEWRHGARRPERPNVWRTLGTRYARVRRALVRSPWFEGSLYGAAYVWRTLLVRTTFIAITGSVGKTTARECLTAILRTRGAVASTPFNRNDARIGVPATVLHVRPWHRFAVIEIGTSSPGHVRRSAALVRPDVGVVLGVDRTHTRSFHDLEATASEKVDLVRALSSAGLAILNADDVRVAAMASDCRGRVSRFGRSPGLDLWADEVSSAWPARLTFRAHHGSQRQPVETDLVGTHWVGSVLAALLAGLSCGVPLRDAAAAVGGVPPFAARMQPVRLPSGATIIRDEYNSAPPVLEAALSAFEAASAERRILVLGDVSDSGVRQRVRFRMLGQRAAALADVVVFAGTEHGNLGVNAAIAAGMPRDRARSFIRLQDAAAFLRTELRDGDLVLLKGRTTDHLSRLVFAQFGEIACWKTDCRLRCACDFCPELGARTLVGSPVATA